MANWQRKFNYLKKTPKTYGIGCHGNTFSLGGSEMAVQKKQPVFVTASPTIKYDY